MKVPNRYEGISDNLKLNTGMPSNVIFHFNLTEAILQTCFTQDAFLK